MRRKIFMLVLPALLMAGPALTDSPLKVVCTVTDLGWLAEQVGGPDAEVAVLCPGTYDPHYLPAKPSLARRLGKADLLCYTGLELEVGWLPLLLDKARNPRVRPGQPGDLDCSQVVAQVLEVPQGQVSRALGDVHPQGNPHYLLDPRKGMLVAQLMADRMGQLQPEAAGRFQERAAELADALEPRIAAWEEMATPLRTRPIVQYTKQWEYLVDWLGMNLLGSVENRPGISPSPRHVDDLITQAQSQGVRVLIAAPWNHLEIAEMAAGRMDAKFVVLPAAVNSLPQAEDYPAIFDFILGSLVKAEK